jgi:hypothetical protein
LSVCDSPPMPPHGFVHEDSLAAAGLVRLALHGPWQFGVLSDSFECHRMAVSLVSVLAGLLRARRSVRPRSLFSFSGMGLCVFSVVLLASLASLLHVPSGCGLSFVIRLIFAAPVLELPRDSPSVLYVSFRACCCLFVELPPLLLIRPTPLQLLVRGPLWNPPLPLASFFLGT